MTDLPASRGTPVSTYRLQLTADFGFADAAGLAGYLADLGVSHAYLSPILQAAPGSTHGYDVTDHSRVSADLGGEDGFRAMAAEFARHGLGVVLDIVPNHMAIPAPEWLNRQLWSVLRNGRSSEFAHWFDIDWDALDGRMLLPVLGAPAADCLAELSLEWAAASGGLAAGEPVLRYYEHAFPVAAGTADLPLPELLDTQHYQLAYWRDAAERLNWRRFFEINSLIAIRAEDPDVFAATHQVVLKLMAEGLIDGLRIDHPDGLADPRGYLRRLEEAAGGAWVVTEKILSPGEQLPADWPCAGTTGYDALRLAGGLFVDPAGEEALTRAYASFTGAPAGFAEVAEEAKREMARGPFTAEVSRLIRLLGRAGDPAVSALAEADLRAVLVELLTGFGVYRAYVVPGEPAPEQAVQAMEAAAAAARRRLPAPLHEALDAVCDVLLGGGERSDARDEAIVRFGQTTGPILAKGVEDTAFYRWTRLAALNEVGGDPDRFGISPADFHAAAGQLTRHWPVTQTTLSTHDTKRQEDVRARLSLLAEQPGEWASALGRLHAAAAQTTDARTAMAAHAAPEPELEYLLWQTLLGAWPVSGERLAAYLEKAMREAKTRTSWLDPDPGYETAARRFALAALEQPEVTALLAGLGQAGAPAARANALGLKLVQLTMPGVADVYQGCELAGLSLVDPDNRRPVDYGRRRELLAALDSGAAADGLDAEKLLVTSRALRLRREHPGWFAGSYEPLAAAGPAAGHAAAFCRGGQAVTVVTRLPTGLARRGGWADTALPLPGEDWRDVLTGASHAGSSPRLADLTAQLPVALLIPAGQAAR